MLSFITIFSHVRKCMSVCRYSPDAGVKFICNIFLIYSCASIYPRNTQGSPYATLTVLCEDPHIGWELCFVLLS